jgi:response regulator RpfG family c-di-GMP phosphodiesterase
MVEAAGSGIPPVVLIADDEPSILAPMESYLGMHGYRVLTAGDADRALELFREHRPPIVITDLKMPGMGGDQLLVELKRIDELVQIIIITGFATIQSAIDTLKAGAFDYIMKPFRLEAVGHAVERAREHLSLLLANRQLQENSIHVLEAMVKTLEQRDFYTAGHSRRVTATADAVAEALALDTGLRRVIHLGGLIHDVGKIGIDDAILRKPGRLTGDEYEIIKSHPERGVEIIGPLEFLRPTIPIIRHHHERFDGTGYPAGLSGDGIPLGARILQVADTYDAMTSSRAYRQALPAEVALEELVRCRGTQFDPELVEVFLGLFPGLAGAAAP